MHQVFNLVEDVVQHNQRLRDENASLRTDIASLHELLQKAGVKPPPSKPPATNATGSPSAPANATDSTADKAGGSTAVNILHDAAARLRPEREAIFQAGLAATTYQHVDDTSCHVGGEFWHTHVIGSPLHASYFTRRGKDRLTALDLLRGGPPRYRFDSLTQRLLRDLRVPKKWRQRAAELPQDCDLSEDELMALLTGWQPPPPASLTSLREAAAIASYRTRPDHMPILIGDDAKQWQPLSDEFGLCWIHEGRHYPKLLPVMPCHQQQLEAFRETLLGLLR